jgi:hypothetical protein
MSGADMSAAVARRNGRDALTPPALRGVYGSDQREAANGTEKEEGFWASEAPLAPAIPSDEPKPVELLRDGRGVYGIGVSDLFDYESVCWSCGVEPELYSFDRPPSDLILRPDRFRSDQDSRGSGYIVLQKITGGFRRGPFMYSREERFRQFIHHEALKRAGLSWPPPDNRHERWWSTDTKQQARNRGIYHGLRSLSLSVINKLIGQALEEAVSPDAVKAARRFPFRYRESIYRAAALSRNALQLTETFPVLALAVYSSWDISPESFANWSSYYKDFKDRQSLAAKLVERGARLRDVADVMNIPMALRQIKPGATVFATDVVCQRPELIAFMPDATYRQCHWLRVMRWAFVKVGHEFGVWAARHVAELPGRSFDEVG